MPIGGLAARVAGWDRWQRGSVSVPGPMAPAGQDTDGILVELQMGGGWVDVTRYVYTRNDITITRGRADESSQVQAGTCALTVNNAGGRFSPRNPTSPYYGLIGRNTPIRVGVVVDGVRRYRFAGEVASWPPKWDISGNDAHVTVETAGILRRLNQGSSPLRSAIYRAITNAAGAANLVQYWPLEDGSTAASFSSATGGQPMTFTGAPTLATDSTFACSTPLPVLNGAKFTGTVPSYPTSSSAQARMLLSIPATGSVNNAVIMRVLTTGSARTWDVAYCTGGDLQITVYGADGSTLAATGAIPGFGINGTPVRLSLELTQTGADVTCNIGALRVTSGVYTVSGTGLITGKTFGRITGVIVNPGGQVLDTAAGHVGVQSTVTSPLDYATALAAAVGETAGNRMRRLCEEEGIQFALIGAPDAVPAAATLANGHTPANEPAWQLLDTVAMGPQLPAKLLDLLTECAVADLGVLFEPRDFFGLGYRTRTSLYNQDARLAIDYEAGELGAAFEPVDDDQAVRNDITTTRPNGSSARQQLDSGALSVNAPPDGVGRYDDSVSVNVATDAALPDQAGWRLHLGTVDEARFPTIALNLLGAAFTGSLDLRNAAIVMDVGDRLTIDNPPPELPPDQISQIVQGFSETFGAGVHTIAVNCSPESPYRIGRTDDLVLGRADTDGSTLAADYPDPASTSLLVATTTPGSPLWTTDPADFPFGVVTGGEVVTVTSISGASSPQTFTVVRGVNGVTKAQASGTDVRLAQPSILSL